MYPSTYVYLSPIYIGYTYNNIYCLLDTCLLYNLYCILLVLLLLLLLLWFLCLVVNIT